MPKTSGFTLIELLVVLSIIVVLTVIAYSVYSNAQKSARDGRRQQEVLEISKVLEQKKIATGNYTALAGGDFNSGNIPFDSRASSVTDKSSSGCGSNNCFYCYKSVAGNCSSSDSTINNSPATSWFVCANLEAYINGLNYFCVANQQ